MMNRRKSIQIMAGLPLLSMGSISSGQQPARKKFRIAHITDTHVKPEGPSGAHTSRCLEEIMAMKIKPDIIFHTGDVIMDALGTEKESVAAQWKLWQELASKVTIPICYCIGNHDVWGIENAKEDTLYAKNWMLKELSMPGRYYSFEKNNWHFIFLDSVQLYNDKWYSGYLDEEQFEWLTAELQRIPPDSPVMIASHIPILSAGIFDWATGEDQKWRVSGALMHGDSHKIQKLFRQHKNIKACISGHLHVLDTVQYDGISYLGCGAICGGWWNRDRYHATKAGYAIIDIDEKGNFERQYINFEWGSR